MALRVHSNVSDSTPFTRCGSLEIHLVPKISQCGYLWSYVWTIDLTSAETCELLLGIMQDRQTAELHEVIRQIIAIASENRQPFGPGNLEDYQIIEARTAVRFMVDPNQQESSAFLVDESRFP